MNRMPRSLKIGIVVGLAVAVVLVGGGNALGVDDKWFGTMTLIGSGVGALTCAHVMFREYDRLHR
jgi:hypothetical protein